MSITAKSLGIDKLDVADRLALMGELWDSVIADTENLPLSIELKSELDKRIEDAESSPDSGIPWEQVKMDTLARLKK